VLTFFIAQLFAQQQRSEERVLGLMSQLAWIDGRGGGSSLAPAAELAPSAVETAAPEQRTEQLRAANPVPKQDSSLGAVERAPTAPPAPITPPAVIPNPTPPAGATISASLNPPPKAPTPIRTASEEPYRGEGLAPGSPLPDFELRTIEGERFRRSQITVKRSSLLFLSTEDEGSKAVVDALRSVAAKQKTLPKLVYVIDGGVPREAIVSWLGRVPKQVTVLLQEDTEVATVLRANGTPSAYFFGAQGLTQGPLRTGAVAILEALGIARVNIPPAARKANGLSPHPQSTQRSYRGLPDRSPAPELALPLVTGGTWMGASGPGRNRVVLFWNPDCPPCQRMLPELVSAAGNWTGFDMAIVTSGRVEENDELANAGLTIPIALQTRQEASRAFHLLESPAAVRISPEGTIVGSPASGAQAIWSLIATIETDSG
jgi:thiol-disulfide isomerase/thioredoxin